MSMFTRHLQSVAVAITGTLLILIPIATTLAQEAEPRLQARVVIRPPSPEQFAAPRGPKALPMEIPEARAKMGWGFMPLTHTIGAPGLKLAIIDGGFRGIKEWLDGKPWERRLVTFVTASESAEPQESEHGYHVYRVARLVLGATQFLLYKALSPRDVLLAIDDAARKGTTVVNLSIAFPALSEIVVQETWFIDNLRKLLSQHEIFVFFAAGNARQATHSWISGDRDQNGYVDFQASLPQRQIVNGLRILLQPGKNAIFFSWNVEQSAEAAYEIELVTFEGRKLGVGRVDPNEKRKGFIVLVHEAAQAEPAAVRVRRLAGPSSGIFMRLSAYPIAVPEDFNGLQTIPTYALSEHPFLVFVGGVGKSETGKLIPSGFSQIGVGADGALFPHVLGPSQLVLDGREIQGTSFAAPFITSIYAAAPRYNLKNLMARTASYAPLDPAVDLHARSRWGVPDAEKAVFRLREVVGPTKVEDISHKVEGDDLVVRFSITRCCMEGMTWFVGPNLYELDTKIALKHPETQKPVGASVMLRSDKPDFVRHPVEVKIPLKGLEPLKGKTYRLQFYIASKTYRALGATTVDQAPEYHVTF